MLNWLFKFCLRPFKTALADIGESISSFYDIGIPVLTPESRHTSEVGFAAESSRIDLLITVAQGPSRNTNSRRLDSPEGVNPILTPNLQSTRVSGPSF